jgi:hypothetical protein
MLQEQIKTVHISKFTLFLTFWEVFHPNIRSVTHFWGRLTTNSCYSQLPESNFTPETVKIAVNVVCLTKKLKKNQTTGRGATTL